MQKVGNTGVDNHRGGHSRLRPSSTWSPGIQFDRSYISPHFVTNRNKGLVEMEDAYILISEKKLASLNELLPLLEKVVQAGKPLLIIADDVEAEIMAALVVNKLRGSLKVAAVKAPAYGELPQGDPSGYCGDDRRNGELGRSRSQARDRFSRYAWTRKEGVIDKQNTTIAEGAGTKAAIEARIAADQAAA